MNFRTPIQAQEIDSSKKRIDYSSKIGLIGSCFVENISAKFDYYKFDFWSNPYGILFNPLAIEKALNTIVNQKNYTEEDLIFDKEQWHSLDHHSDFSDSNSQRVLEKIHTTIEESHHLLKETTHFIVTLGTAWVYHHIESDQTVANCHKIPQQHFKKRLMPIAEIKKSLQHTIRLLKTMNPDMQILFSLSPVRHLKDGMLANSRGKAYLLAAIYEVVSSGSNTFYFPAYEILMDDLRDYRFYAQDMLHPNEMAVNYIWDFFKEIWISEESFPVMKEVSSVQKALDHRAFNPGSDQHKLFISKVNKQKKELNSMYGIRF